MFFNTTKFYTISFFCKHNFFIDEKHMQKQPPEAFRKKMCSWKFHKIHRKTPVPETFLNKVAGLRSATLLKKRLWPQAATLLKKRLWYRCFSVNFVKFLRTPFLQNASERLLLNVGY